MNLRGRILLYSFSALVVLIAVGSINQLRDDPPINYRDSNTDISKFKFSRYNRWHNTPDILTDKIAEICDRPGLTVALLDRALSDSGGAERHDSGRSEFLTEDGKSVNLGMIHYIYPRYRIAIIPTTIVFAYYDEQGAIVHCTVSVDNQTLTYNPYRKK